jgi:hypothetical protein
MGKASTATLQVATAAADGDFVDASPAWKLRAGYTFVDIAADAARAGSECGAQRCRTVEAGSAGEAIGRAAVEGSVSAPTV